MVVNTIRYKLKLKEINHSWSNIIRIMNTQKMVTTSLKNEKNQIILLTKCSQPNSEVKAIYQALKYKEAPFNLKKYVVPH